MPILRSFFLRHSRSKSVLADALEDFDAVLNRAEVVDFISMSILAWEPDTGRPRHMPGLHGNGTVTDKAVEQGQLQRNVALGSCAPKECIEGVVVRTECIFAQ